MVDFGRDYPHITKIYPFYDRPDIGVDVLFYPVDLDAPIIPYPNPFVLRNWDRLEQLRVPVLGTRYDPKTYWRGPLPDHVIGTPCGTAEEWQNGISYETYSAGQCVCSAGEWTISAYVSSLSCPDDSISIDHPTGDVHEIINLNHSNAWLVQQTFQPGDILEVAVVVKALPNQDAPWMELRNGDDVAQVTVKQPLGSAYTPQLTMCREDGVELSYWSNSYFRMKDGASGYGMAVTSGPLMQFDLQGFWLRPNSTLAYLGAKICVGRPFYFSTSLTPDAELYISMSGNEADMAIAVLGDAGLGVDEVLIASGDGRELLGGQSKGGSSVGLENVQLDVRVADGNKGLVLSSASSNTSAQPWIVCEDAVNSVVFRLNADGQLWTNQAGFTGPTLGNVVGRMPIYDNTGSLVGYLPLYDDIT